MYHKVIKNKIIKTITLLTLLMVFNFGFSQQKSIFDIARKGSLKEIKNIFKNNPKSIDSKSKEGYSPLTLACYYGNNEVAEFLINKVSNINAKSSYGTPLMAAVVKNNEKLVDLLLKKNVELNATDTNGTTALHYAVIFGYTNIVILLTNSKCNTNLKDNRGKTANDYAKITGNKQIIQLLKNQ